MLLQINDQIAIPLSEFHWEVSRSGGPGGQNVNKVASAVQLRCDLKAWPALPERVRQRLRTLAGRRLTGDDVIVITAQRLRTQEQNRRDALERLSDLVEQARIEPKVRRATKPTRASKQRRLEHKTQRGQVKRSNNCRCTNYAYQNARQVLAVLEQQDHRQRTCADCKRYPVRSPA